METPTTPTIPTMARTKSEVKRRALKKNPMMARAPATAPDSAPLKRPKSGPLASIRRHNKPPVAGTIRKPARYRPGERILLEIRKYQAGADLLIPRTSFGRLVREIAAGVSTGNEDLAWEAAAMEALQYVAETHMTVILSLTNDAAIHAGRQTVQKKDMDFVDAFEKKSTSGV